MNHQGMEIGRMSMNKGMEIVRVKKEELLSTLKKNRDEHREIFLEALEGYHTAAKKALKDRIDEAQKNQRVSLRFTLIQPTDQTKEYNRIIKMLEMSVDSEIELTQREFANYVMDDWDWMDQFLTSNSGYSQKAMSKWENTR